MKRILVLTTMLLTIAIVANADEHHHMAAAAGSHADLVQYLQLTADQQAIWQNAHRDFETANQPLIAKSRETGQQLESALKAQSDACTVGSLLLSHQATLDQLKTAHVALEEKLKATLTPEQKTRYDAFSAARPLRERHMD
jgi:hypothetical protein